MKWHRDRMVEQLSNLYVPMNIKDQNGVESTGAVQVLLQPIEMWSLVFPKENLDPILRTLNPSKDLGISIPSTVIGGVASPKRRMPLALLRKGLGLKPIPKFKPEGKRFPIWTNHMQIVGLGIKEDYSNEYGNECL